MNVNSNYKTYVFKGKPRHNATGIDGVVVFIVITKGKAMSRILGVIPARLESTRLPRKLLLAETGKPLIVHTIEQAKKSHLLDEVVVATGDQEIADVCKEYCQVILTEEDHQNGTSRIAEAVRLKNRRSIMERPDVVVNIQGDEPEISPRSIDRLVAHMLDERPRVATLATPARNTGDLGSSDRVKVAITHNCEAMMFSRSLIPFPIGTAINEEVLSLQYPHNPMLIHIGVYAYTPFVLQEFVKHKQSTLEKAERLEQLRFLQNGEEIKVVIVPESHSGIDTAEDYMDFVRRFKKQ